MDMVAQDKLNKREVMHTNDVSGLVHLYTSIKSDIDNRLQEFSQVFNSNSEERLFQEMCFCVCTPQTDAHKGWAAATLLVERNQLFKPPIEHVAATLREAGVRFHKNKSRYIVSNRKYMFNIYSTLNKLVTKHDHDIKLVRNDLATMVSGWGLKEASHFLRNIGWGKSICILDRHILRRLVEYGVIDSIPKTLDKKTYLKIESKMISFAEKTNIPNDALDFVFWYEAKDELFK